MRRAPSIHPACQVPPPSLARPWQVVQKHVQSREGAGAHAHTERGGSCRCTCVHARCTARQLHILARWSLWPLLASLTSGTWASNGAQVCAAWWVRGGADEETCQRSRGSTGGLRSEVEAAPRQSLFPRSAMRCRHWRRLSPQDLAFAEISGMTVQESGPSEARKSLGGRPHLVNTGLLGC